MTCEDNLEIRRSPEKRRTKKMMGALQTRG
jgi:hypothetical protein